MHPDFEITRDNNLVTLHYTLHYVLEILFERKEKKQKTLISLTCSRDIFYERKEWKSKDLGRNYFYICFKKFLPIFGKTRREKKMIHFLFFFSFLNSGTQCYSLHDLLSRDDSGYCYSLQIRFVVLLCCMLNLLFYLIYMLMYESLWH